MDKTEKPLLLFVDDSKVMRLAADKMLGGEFRVEVAEDGLQAWTIISQNPAISVVFSDLAMPEMDGYALLEKIRTSDDDGIAGLPVIIVTGAENDEEAALAAVIQAAMARDCEEVRLVQPPSIVADARM